MACVQLTLFPDSVSIPTLSLFAGILSAAARNSVLDATRKIVLYGDSCKHRAKNDKLMRSRPTTVASFNNCTKYVEDVTRVIEINLDYNRKDDSLFDRCEVG